MAKLAIRGHETRGNEVIELLEMLGGWNNKCLHGVTTGLYYFIDYKEICSCESVPYTYIIFTLEEFLEKFPYKVGDKVKYKYDKNIYFIKKMYWEKDKVVYQLSDECYTDGSSHPDILIFDVESTNIQPYKEKIMEEELMPKIDFSKYCKNKYLLDMGDYEIKVEDGKTYVVRKKFQYPKTYEECCSVIGFCSDTLKWNNPFHINRDTHPYIKHLDNLMEIFCKLLICRNAYWKIAGEQMGLGKPWEPDWINEKQISYGLYRELKYSIINPSQFVFPIKEIRDAFLDNFKGLIKQCRIIVN